MLIVFPKILNSVLLYAGIPLFIFGVILLILDICQCRKQKRLLSLEESVDRNRVVWGLWHTGARVKEDDLLDSTTSIKRILLFDCCKKRGFAN